MPVAIIGMHRSGTSLVAALLNIAGLYLGEEADLLPAAESNEKGHFEHIAFRDLNLQMLAVLGGTSTEPPLLAPGWESAPEMRPVREQFATEVEKYFSGKPQWGWKEPRASLAVALYRSGISDLQCVLCVRHPLDVAASLKKRDNLPVAHSVLLWHYYTQIALRDTEANSTLIVHYEPFFERPVSNIDRLVTFAGMRMPAHGSPKYDELVGFIEPGLKHHGSSLEDLRGSPDSNEDSVQLYETLLSQPETAHSFSKSEAGAAMLERVHHRLVNLGLTRLTGENARYAKHRDDLLAHRDHLLQGMENYKESVEKYKAMHADLLGSFEELQEAYRQQAKHLEAVQAEVDNLNQMMSSLGHRLVTKVERAARKRRSKS